MMYNIEGRGCYPLDAQLQRDFSAMAQTESETSQVRCLL